MDIVKNINSIFLSTDYKVTYGWWVFLRLLFIKLLFFNKKYLNLV